MKKIILILMVFLSLSVMSQNTQVLNNKLILKNTPNLSFTDSLVTKDANQMLRSTSVNDFKTQLGISNYLNNIVEDLTPQLGGNLDLNSRDITGSGNINTSGNLEILNTVKFTGYPSTRADVDPVNILHTDISGNLLSSSANYFATKTELDNKLDLTGGTLTGDLTAPNFIGDGSQLTGIESGALEVITEGGNTGIAIKGRDPANYGDIGNGAVDLSFSDNISTIRGATGNYALVTGLNNIGDNNSLISGQGNVGKSHSGITGQNNTGGIYSTLGGLSNFAPSYAETAFGLYGTNYTATSLNNDPSDRLFSLGNGTDASRNDALIIYKSGNAILDGELTADKFIGDGSQLTNVDAITLNGISDYFKNENLINTNASIGTSAGLSISLYQNAGGSSNFPQAFGGSVLFNYANSYQRTFSIWKDYNGSRWYLFDYNSDRTLKSANEVYHSGNSAPTRTINTSSLQTSSTLNSSFPFADNPEGTMVVNENSAQSFIYIRVNGTQWKAVSLGSVI